MLKITGNSLRVDKWLWQARFFKSRTLATKIAASGRLRVNRKIITKPRTNIKPGDILTFPKGSQIRVIEVLMLGVRRGPASEAILLYKDLNPPEKVCPSKIPGKQCNKTGRPTKSERRLLDRLRKGTG